MRATLLMKSYEGVMLYSFIWFSTKGRKKREKKMQVHKGKGIVFKCDLSQVTKKQS